MEKFSVIIPTMWKSPLLFKMLEKYENCSLISEVIIIDNNYDFQAIFQSQKFQKVEVYSLRKNIYVNPAWNMGASIAKYTIILANDDIYIERFDELMKFISICNCDIIGATINNLSFQLISISNWNKYQGFPGKSFGCFMVCRKFIPIPEEMKILCGDNWLFDHADTIGLIGRGYIETPISVTIKSDPEFAEIGKRDKEIYKRIKRTPNP